MGFGIEYYGPTYGGRPYHREMGETPEDMARAVKWQEQQEANARGDYYRPREVGERPDEVPSRAKQAEYAKQYDDTYVPSYTTRPDRTPVPREMGERPEDVARTKDRSEKTWDEMTEQERVLDMYA